MSNTPTEDANSTNETIRALREENDKLRGFLARGQGICVYCNLPAEDIAKCSSGFPGCARMDDMMNAIESRRILDLEARMFELQRLLDEQNEEDELL